MRSLSCVVVGAIGLVACSKDRPKLTQERMPQAIRAITLGKTTEAEILAAYPSAKVGDMTFNDAKSHEIKVESPALTFITKPPTKDGVVYRLYLEEPNACDWVKTQIDPLEGSTSCPGNRKTGISKHGGSHHCMDMPDGTLVTIDCNPRESPRPAEIELWAHY
jgi:hypothetical protein